MVSTAIRAVVPTPSAAPTPEPLVLASGGEFTVGAEEELFLLDDERRLDPGVCASLMQQIAADAPALPGAITAELYAAQIEFASVPSPGADELVPQLRGFRSALTAAGGRALAAGLHPTAPFGDAVLTAAPRYALIGDSMAGLLRTATAAFQVHVGLPDERAAMLAYSGMRSRLAVLQALASSSPFWHGRDSGMASARWAVISSYPRGGVPPVVHSWDEYADLVTAVQAAAEAPEHTQVWFDARLQPRLGTLEVRVMDAQPSVRTAAGLAALTQGAVRYCVENPDGVEVPSPVLAENNFRVARHGLETTITDGDGTHHPVRALAARLLEQARSVLRPEGADAPLEAVEQLLSKETEYARQRRLHAAGGLDAVVDDLVERTSEV